MGDLENLCKTGTYTSVSPRFFLDRVLILRGQMGNSEAKYEASA